MKKTIYFLMSLILLSGCAIHQPTVTYENTNASLIQKSIKDLNTLDNLKSKIDKSDKIAIVGLEDYKTGDYSLLATLEDEIIKEFVEKGYTVLERDDDLIYRLFSEESSNYKYVNKFKSYNRSSAIQQSSGGFFGSSNQPYDNAYLSGSHYSHFGASSISNKYHNQLYQSSLQSADKIISYRVIESGIIYDYEEKEAGIGEVEREARTILEVRLTDAKTSEIITAITLDGEANDFVDEEDISALKSFSYRYYSHTFPKTHGNPTKNTIKKEKKKSTLPWIMGTLGFITVISLLGN